MDIYYHNNFISNYSDEQLAQLVNKGNHDAYSILLNRFLPYIKSKASSFHALGLDENDFVQEGLLSLYICTGAYKADHKTSFKTFTENCILRRMISLYRNANANKNIPLNTYLSLDDTCVDVSASYLDPEQLLIDDECLLELRNKIVSALSDLEYRVLNCYLNDISYRDIANTLQISTKAVNNALQRIRMKLKALL